MKSCRGKGTKKTERQTGTVERDKPRPKKQPKVVGYRSLPGWQTTKNGGGKFSDRDGKRNPK